MGKILYSKICAKKDFAKKEEFHAEFEFGENKYDIIIKPYLSAADWNNTLEAAVDSLFTGDGRNTEYKPFFKEFVFEYAVVSSMTNVTIPSDPEVAWGFLMTTHIGSFVMNEIYSIDARIIPWLREGYEELIKYKLATIEKKGKLDELISRGLDILDDAAEKINSSKDVDGLIELAKELAGKQDGLNDQANDTLPM